jgi:hypothetical protein
MSGVTFVGRSFLARTKAGSGVSQRVSYCASFRLFLFPKDSVRLIQ